MSVGAIPARRAGPDDDLRPSADTELIVLDILPAMRASRRLC